MNKPAAKEPSMDEILSSIRQIISDEDEVAPEENQAQETKATDDENANISKDDMSEVEDALELSPDQIISDDSSDIDELAEFNPVEQGEVISKDIKDDKKENEKPADVSEGFEDLVVADDLSFDEPEPEPKSEVQIEEKPTSSLDSALPDSELADDIADSLLEPATAAVVSNAFSKLGNLGFEDNNLTVENMIKQMLRPMLKEWLNENLPSIVEKSVRKEVERLSRGG